MQNVCDEGYIKHGSDFSCVCDAGHTVQFNELFAMRRNKRNGQSDEGVCDIHHTVHWDGLCVIRQHNGNGSTEQDCVIRGKQVCNLKCVRRPIITPTIAANKPCELLCL